MDDSEFIVSRCQPAEDEPAAAVEDKPTDADAAVSNAEADTRIYNSSVKRPPPPVSILPQKLPIYTGTADSPTELFDFVTTVRDTLILIPIYSTSAIMWLKRGLAGIALKEVNFFIRDNPTKTVEDVLEFLEKRFNPDIHVHFLFAEFYPRKQQPGENIYDYAHALQDLYHRILRLDSFAITDFNLRDTFILNLHDAALKLHLMPHLDNDTKSFEDVKSLAVAYGKRMSWFVNDVSLQVSNQTVTQSIPQNPSTSSNRSDLICHWCQQSGHIERFCKAKQAYFNRRRPENYPNRM
jgi:hypothetical protein